MIAKIISYCLLPSQSKFFISILILYLAKLSGVDPQPPAFEEAVAPGNTVCPLRVILLGSMLKLMCIRRSGARVSHLHAK